MKYGKILTAILIILFLYSVSYSQAIEPNRITIQAGISVYGNPHTGPQVYVEFPFSLNRSEFLFLSLDSAKNEVRASIFAEIVLSDTLGRNIDSASTYFYSKAPDTMAAKEGNIKLFNKLALFIRPGIYKGQMNIIDVASKRKGSFLYDRIEIDSIVYDRLSLSSLELAYNINPGENAITLANPRMIKNEREVIPNPMGIFSVDDSALCVYVEIYNLSYDSSKNNMFKANYKIYRSDGSLEFDYGDILKQNPDSSSVISNKLSIAGWQPGRYDLKLVVTDLSSNTNAMASKRIIIFPKSGYLRDAVKFAKTSQLDTAGVKTISNVLQFLMSFQESATYNSLNDTGKVRFARQFFKDHDPSPATETNEFLDDLFRRYEFANAHFSLSAHLRDGWQSDRGRVLMQYGFWGERHEITAPITSCGVEYWTYSSLPNSAMKIGVAQKDIIFIFDDGGGHALLDKAGCYGLYQLVHSNAPGEIYNSEWDERIKLPNLGI